MEIEFRSDQLPAPKPGIEVITDREKARLVPQPTPNKYSTWLAHFERRNKDLVDRVTVTIAATAFLSMLLLVAFLVTEK